AWGGKEKEMEIAGHCEQFHREAIPMDVPLINGLPRPDFVGARPKGIPSGQRRQTLVGFFSSACHFEKLRFWRDDEKSFMEVRKSWS
ncbi:MAG: hypothetical protein WAO19_01835, partial [Candidatus Kryptoniota bacterium]